MRLEKLSIKNYKSIREQIFEPTRFSCLVGENNAGKSSVMQAVVTALNKPSLLPASLYYDPNMPVEFEFRLANVNEQDLARISEEHRPRIAALVIDGTLTFCVRYPPGDKVTLTTKRLVPIEVRYRQEAIDNALEGKRGAVAIRTAIEASYPEFLDAMQEPATTLGAAKAFLAGQIAQLPSEQCQLAEAPLPSGISSSISTLLPEPIYIPAVKNLNDELKTTQSTSFGRLLGLLLEDMAPDLDNIGKSLEALNLMLNRVVENDAEVDKRHEKVRALEGRVESFLGENFPSAKVELRIPPPELKTILNAAQIYIDDGSKDLIDNKGDGIKRSLTFALLQAYVQHLDHKAADKDEGAAAPQPLLFLFEEPELYLHPKSQRVLFKTLARIAETHQVVVTTHSPLFFEPGVTAAFVRVAKHPAIPKPEAVLYPVNFELNQASAETFQLARFEHADAAFFSQRVVLFEGESDDAFCRHVAKLLNAEWDLEKRNIALVRVSGKGNFQKFRSFFTSFGIDVKMVADLDALFEGFQHLGANQAAIEMRHAVIRMLDQRVEARNIKPEPSAKQIQRRVQHATWKTRYETTKNALLAVRETREVTDEALELLDSLFVWEQDISRLRVCTEDTEATEALVPLLDSLRAQGICVLARGAIEDYYPDGVSNSGPKPSRALAACSIVTSKELALGLSKPFGAGRRTELEEIFEELFR